MLLQPKPINSTVLKFKQTTSTTTTTTNIFTFVKKYFQFVFSIYVTTSVYAAVQTIYLLTLLMRSKLFI